MERQWKFLIAKEEFKGTAQANAYSDGGEWLVNCSGYLHNNNGKDLTIAEYSAIKNEQYEVLTWEEMEVKYMTPYLKSLQGPFVECTKEVYWDALECLPPLRWTRSAGNPEFFFLGECFTYNLYSCFVSWKGKYYSALRDINTPAKVVIADFIKSIE
jgi:hypothetical protein